MSNTRRHAFLLWSHCFALKQGFERRQLFSKVFFQFIEQIFKPRRQQTALSLLVVVFASINWTQANADLSEPERAVNLLITIKDLTSAMKTVAFIVLLCLLLGFCLQVVELRKNSDSNLKNHSPTWLWEKREETVTNGASLKQTGKAPNHKR